MPFSLQNGSISRDASDERGRLLSGHHDPYIMSPAAWLGDEDGSSADDDDEEELKQQQRTRTDLLRYSSFACAILSW